MSLDLKSLAPLFLLAGLVVGCTHGQDPVAKQRHYEDTLHANLPPGSSLQEVEAFIAALKLPQHYDSNERTLVAFDRNVETSGMVTTDIRFECHFDAADKLRDCTTGLVFTGP